MPPTRAQTRRSAAQRVGARDRSRRAKRLAGSTMMKGEEWIQPTVAGLPYAERRAAPAQGGARKSSFLMPTSKMRRGRYAV